MTQQIWTTVPGCRLCGGTLEPILDLGLHYLPDWNHEGSGIQAPLVQARCSSCKAVQLLHSVSKDLLYKHYWFRSDGNSSAVDILWGVVTESLKRVKLAPGDIALDIGGNVGTLLDLLPPRVIKVNIDPAHNLVGKSRARGHNVAAEFFSAEVYRSLVGERKATLVTAVAMFYDLEDPVGFCQDVASILSNNGLFVIQQNYLPTMLTRGSFDNIGFEHLLYLCVRDMHNIARRAGLVIEDVEWSNALGGSFRVFLRKDPGRTSQDLRATLESEQAATSPEAFRNFVTSCQANREAVVKFIRGKQRSGKKTYIYGASTRGMTILQYFGLTKEDCPKAVERNPMKIGMSIAGLDIPVISEEQVWAEKPDYMLVLPYFYREEFIKREEQWLRAGGRFIFPLPRPQVYGIRSGRPFEEFLG